MADAQQFLRGSKVLYGPFMKFAGSCSLKDYSTHLSGTFLGWSGLVSRRDGRKDDPRIQSNISLSK